MRLKIQSMKELRAEMLSVARGERKAPAGARQASFESVEAVMRLLTPENRQLLAAIDIYVIWHVVLLGVGLLALGGLSRGKVVASVAATEAVALLLQAVPAAILASLAGLTIVRPFLF